MAGGTGTSSRGRGGKFKKYTRGGGKHFSRDIRPVDAEGNEVSMWSTEANKKDSEDDDDDDDDSSEEEDSEEEDSEEETSEEEDSDSDDAGPSKAPAPVDTREDRKAQKKARQQAAIAKQKAKTIEVGDLPSSDDEDSEDEDDDMPANPNHSKAARKQTTASSDVDDITEGVKNIQAPSRREREALEAAAAKEKYMRLHHQGKTDEAKADLARLKLIREQRAADAARRQAEKEERIAQEKAKKEEFEAREARKKEATAAIKKGKKK